MHHLIDAFISNWELTNSLSKFRTRKESRGVEGERRFKFSDYDRSIIFVLIAAMQLYSTAPSEIIIPYSKGNLFKK